MSSIFNSNLNRFLVTIILMATIVALSAYAFFTFKQAGEWNQSPTTINVLGTGEVINKPDIAQFSFSVRAEGADAAIAQEKSGTSINALNAYLKEQGIDDKDVKTENYTLNPKYKYEQKPCMFGQYCPPGEQKIDGFEVSQTITVKVRAIDKAGTLLAGVGSKGATDISGLNFTIDNDDDAKAKARVLAIDDARVQADKLAKALGVKLGRMISYYEDVPMTPYPGAYGAPMMDAVAGAKSFESVSVPAGENKVVSKVNLTYEIK